MIATVKERPILFSGAMVREILKGRKTQTRRIFKIGKTLPPANTLAIPESVGWPGEYRVEVPTSKQFEGMENYWVHSRVKCPYGKPGDRLWVRETWFDNNGDGERNLDFVYYRADSSPEMDGETIEREGGGWKPSIHMPRWASRILLEIVSIRVERLQIISERDARAEGVREYIYPACGDHPDMVGYVTDADGEWDAAHKTPQQAYAVLWDSINGKYEGRTWADSPWVWVIEFRRVQEGGTPCN